MIRGLHCHAYLFCKDAPAAPFLLFPPFSLSPLFLLTLHVGCYHCSTVINYKSYVSVSGHFCFQLLFTTLILGLLPIFKISYLFRCPSFHVFPNSRFHVFPTSRFHVFSTLKLLPQQCQQHSSNAVRPDPASSREINIWKTRTVPFPKDKNPLDEWRRGAVHLYSWLGVWVRRVLAIPATSGSDCFPW